MNAPQVPPSEEMSFRCSRRTRWSDEDNQGVVNNAVYLTLFEEVRHAYFEERGLLAENHFPFLLAQADVRFLRPGRGGAEVTVELLTTRIGSSSFEQVYRVIEARSGEVWCESAALLVVYDPETGGSRPMDDAFRAALSAPAGAAGAEP